MTRSRDVADTQDNLGGAVAPVVSGKNVLINGSMEIAQRGTTFTSVNSVYTLDRWYYTSFGTGTTATITQGSTDSVPGFRYYAKVAATTSSTSNFNFSQAIETANVIPLRGKVVTLSFWMRTPVAFTNVFVINLRYSTSTDVGIVSAGVGTNIGSDVTFTGQSTWTKYTQSYTIPSDASSLGFILGTYNNTVSTANFDITGVQLELGSVASPFARAGGSIGGELALCQRYYFRNNSGNTNFSWFAWGIGQGSSQALFSIPCPVTMRTTPTVVEFANLGLAQTGGISAITTLVHSNSSPSAAFLQSNGTNTADVFYRLIANNSSSAYIGIGAEL